MYRYHTPSGDKSCDGMAMALRAGLALRDMEMVQFHPTGLLAGPDTRMTGTVLEEGLRGSGGWLIDATGERFMFEYDRRGERATRDIVARALIAPLRRGPARPPRGRVAGCRNLAQRAGTRARARRSRSPVVADHRDRRARRRSPLQPHLGGSPESRKSRAGH